MFLVEFGARGPDSFALGVGLFAWTNAGLPYLILNKYKEGKGN